MVVPDDELEKQIQECNDPAMLREILMRAAEKQGTVRRGEVDYEPVTPDPKVQREFHYTKQIPIPSLGMMLEISAPSAERLAQMETEAKARFGLR